MSEQASESQREKERERERERETERTKERKREREREYPRAIEAFDDGDGQRSPPGRVERKDHGELRSRVRLVVHLRL